MSKNGKLVDFAFSNGMSYEERSVSNDEPSLTRQEFKDECDINSIMSRYDAYLADPMKSVREPIYYDFASMPKTLMEAMEVVKTGAEAFMRLPAAVRREFDNDPAAFVDYAADPSNVDQMRVWGLAQPVPPGAVPSPAPAAAADAEKAAGATPEPRAKK